MQLKTVYSYKTADEELSTRIAALENGGGGGGGSDQYALKRDTVLETTLSMGRAYSSTVGQSSFAFGYNVTASGGNSHAEGVATVASGEVAYAEGIGTIANGISMHAQGKFNKPDNTIWPDWVASRPYAVGDKVTYQGEGYTCKTANYDDTFYSDKWTHETTNGGKIAFVIGNGTANNDRSNAFAVKWDGSVQEGGGTTASGSVSHAEGGGTTASGLASHAEGGGTLASGAHSHAEGSGTQATGAHSHAEGSGTQATGTSSHAEGGGTTASESNSHAEGVATLASGGSSHAEGISTIANGFAMHAQGKYNKPDDTVWPEWVASKSYAVGDKVTYQGEGYTCKTANSDATFIDSKWIWASSNGGEIAFVIGNGTAENARSNATVITWDGDIKTAGSLTIGAGTADEVTITPDQLRKLIAMIPD